MRKFLVDLKCPECGYTRKARVKNLRNRKRICKDCKEDDDS